MGKSLFILMMVLVFSSVLTTITLHERKVCFGLDQNRVCMRAFVLTLMTAGFCFPLSQLLLCPPLTPHYQLHCDSAFFLFFLGVGGAGESSLERSGSTDPVGMLVDITIPEIQLRPIRSNLSRVKRENGG